LTTRGAAASSSSSSTPAFVPVLAGAELNQVKLFYFFR
jgi:hypothetical protein